jgi:N-acetylglucosaminyldiphosphoundecaprenol N-acetyl-beta-D-mannosaminyltransferase
MNKLYGLSFFDRKMSDFVNIVNQAIIQEKKTFIVTVNPVIISNTREPIYKRIIEKADYFLPDGEGICLSAKLAGTKLNERITGIDLSYELLRLANKKNYSIYLLGASSNVVKSTVKVIDSFYPGVKVVGSMNGYGFNESEVVKEIKEKKPDIILVGMGSPKQELWIGKNLSSFSKGIFIGVGGSFDVISGEVKRCPKPLRILKLEWLYRTFQKAEKRNVIIRLCWFILISYFEIIRFRRTSPLRLNNDKIHMFKKWL